MNPETVIGVIPARYNSQRLPAKALIDLAGKPMVQRVYEQAKAAKLLSRVIVATDDERIEKVVKGFGGDVVMTSPELRSGSDRVAEVAKTVPGTVFVNIQGDEPLIPPAMIDQAVQTLLNHPEAVVATLAKKIESPEEIRNPAIVKVVFDRSSRALYFSRSAIPHVRDHRDVAEWPSAASLYKHVGIYVFRKESLLSFADMNESALEQAEKLEQLRMIEAGKIIAVGLTELDSVPVDTQADVERVLSILKTTTHQPMLSKDS